MEGTKQGGPHPTREELEGLIRGELPKKEARRVVRHLLTRCRECVSVTREIWFRGDRPPGFDASVRRLAALVSPAPAEPGSL